MIIKIYKRLTYIIKLFLNWIFEGNVDTTDCQPVTSRIRTYMPGRVICCYDCQMLGYRAEVPITEWDKLSDMWETEIPHGWREVWVGSRRLYLCKNCLYKRKKQGEKLLY